MLPKNGGAALFSVAGKWGRASEAHEDTHIVVSSNGTIVAELPVTVRVRKDAEKLTADERKRLLKSVIELEKGGWFNRYAALHNVAGHLVHSTSEQRNYIFLAWHRTLLLDLERRLQQVDPAIAIPYWRFETATPSIFSSGFLGEVPRDSDSSEVEFEPPMDAFRVAFAFNPVWWRDGRLLRDVVTNDWASGGWLPSDRVQANVEAIMQAAAYPIAGELIQRNFHLGVHNKIGYYMSNPETAAVDPVFYLLHANVDHLWARWQRAAAGRETPDTDVGFYPRGRYRDGCCGTNQQPRTAFGDEPLWPWNFRTGPNSDVTGPWADPPDGTLRIPFPGAAGFGPIHEEPLAKEMVDYLDEAGVGASLGFCYDDIGF